MKQGEIWLVSLDPTIGSEIRKTHPSIIVNENALGKLPLKIIVPITDWKERYAVAPWLVQIHPNDYNDLTKPSSADCFQIRSIAEERCIKKLGQVEANILAAIRKALAIILNIE